MLIQPALGGHFQPGSLATLCPITKEGARTRKNKYAGRRWDMLSVLLQLVLECCLLLPQTLSWLCILSPWVSFSIPSHCCCLTGNDALAVCRKIKLVLGWGSHVQRFLDINVWLSNIYLQLPCAHGDSLRDGQICQCNITVCSKIHFLFDFLKSGSTALADTHPTWLLMRINRHESDMAASTWPSLVQVQLHQHNPEGGQRTPALIKQVHPIRKNGMSCNSCTVGVGPLKRFCTLVWILQYLPFQQVSKLDLHYD